jgi:hypothetical protein
MAHYISLVIFPETKSSPEQNDVDKVFGKFKRKHDYYDIGGIWDGMLNPDPKLAKPFFIKRLFSGDPNVVKRNSCLLKDIPEDIEPPYSVVLPSKKWVCEDDFGDKDHNSYANERPKGWLDEFEKIKMEYANNVCVLVDGHL